MEKNISDSRCKKILKHYNNCVKELITDPNIILKTNECLVLLDKYVMFCEKK